MRPKRYHATWHILCIFFWTTIWTQLYDSSMEIINEVTSNVTTAIGFETENYWQWSNNSCNNLSNILLMIMAFFPTAFFPCYITRTGCNYLFCFQQCMWKIYSEKMIGQTIGEMESILIIIIIVSRMRLWRSLGVKRYFSLCFDNYIVFRHTILYSQNKCQGRKINWPIDCTN